MTTDQDPIPVIVLLLILSAALLCYTLTGHPFPDARPFGR